MASFTGFASHEIILHIYTIDLNGGLPPPSNFLSKVANFFHEKIMTPTGFGTYHTSLDVGGFNYSFAATSGATSGITKTKAIDPTSPQALSSCPPGVTYTESLILSSSSPSPSSLSKILNSLSKTFTPTSYHLLNRNCNHFTEALTLSLNLPSYPPYLNRCARTGTLLIKHEICDVKKEASLASGNKVTTEEDVRRKNKKKVITEKQRKALEALKK
mmetsp:Transcript_15775/g.29494  ORF Transcript_15775/g.29494 Transcript_15775/m.29494 type:complete len:216 (+) Transcript_15775:138-785(+)